MRVLTLDRERFREECRRLAEMVAASGCMPRLVVGIATGGVVVMQSMKPVLNDLLAVKPSYLEISSRRPGTEVKEQRLKGLIRRLPRPVANLLRIMEHVAGSLRRVRPPRRVVVPDGLVAALRSVEKGAQVLVVDDALDSGATMRDVVDSLHAVRGDIDIRTAVIASTRGRQAVKADFSLYGKNTLIRFPWSLDA